MFYKESDPSTKDYQSTLSAALELSKLTNLKWQCVKHESKDQHVLVAKETVAKEDRHEAEKEFKFNFKLLTEALGFEFTTEVTSSKRGSPEGHSFVYASIEHPHEIAAITRQTFSHPKINAKTRENAINFLNKVFTPFKSEAQKKPLWSDDKYSNILVVKCIFEAKTWESAKEQTEKLFNNSGLNIDIRFIASLRNQIDDEHIAVNVEIANPFDIQFLADRYKNYQNLKDNFHNSKYRQAFTKDFISGINKLITSKRFNKQTKSALEQAKKDIFVKVNDIMDSPCITGNTTDIAPAVHKALVELIEKDILQRPEIKRQNPVVAFFKKMIGNLGKIFTSKYQGAKLELYNAKFFGSRAVFQLTKHKQVLEQKAKAVLIYSPTLGR